MKNNRISLYDSSKAKKINETTLKLFKKYNIELNLRELSEKTIHQYYYDLMSWWIYVLDNQSNVSVLDLDEDDITEFLFFCKQQGNSTRRMKRRMASISAFYKFLKKKRLINFNPMDCIDRPKKDVNVNVQTFLSEEQVSNLKLKLDELIKEYSYKGILNQHIALQYKTFCLIALSTMARVNAISSLTWEQCDLINRTFDDVIEKEGYVVTLYFSEEVKEMLLLLKRFRKDNDINDNGYILVAQTFDGETPVFNKSKPDTLWRWTKRIGKLINVPELHPHDFRHTGATILKNKGMALEDVSQLLNHQSTDVTNKFYIKADKKIISENKDKYLW